MNFLLDTNICSAHLRRPALLAHRMLQYTGRLYLPSIALAELLAGAYHLANPVPLVAGVDELLKDVQVVDFDRACAESFGRLRGGLMRSGIVLSPVDALIAAVALTHQMTLVTHNVRDFQSIPNLQVDDWLAP